MHSQQEDFFVSFETNEALCTHIYCWCFCSLCISISFCFCICAETNARYAETEISTGQKFCGLGNFVCERSFDESLRHQLSVLPRWKMDGLVFFGGAIV